MRRGRWHNAVALCRRFGLLGSGPPFRCALALGVLAQQRIISEKELALQKVRERKSAAVEAQKIADKKLADARISAFEKDPQEP